MIRIQNLREYKLANDEWLLDGLLSPYLNVLSGQAKAGKTMFAGHLVSSLTTGREILGKKPDKPLRKIAWMGSDGGWQNELKKRIADDVAKSLDMFEMPTLSEGLWVELGELLQAKNYQLLVIDHFANLAGSNDANEQSAVSTVLKHVKIIYQKYSVPVLLLAHAGKQEKQGRAAHSYVIEATARVLLQLDNNKDVKSLLVRANEIPEHSIHFKLSPSECTISAKEIKSREPRKKAASNKATKFFKLAEDSDLNSQSAAGRALERMLLTATAEGGRQQITIWRRKGLVSINEDKTVAPGPNLQLAEGSLV